MARPAALTLEALPAVAPDLGQALLGWDQWLATERRAADHTLAAYRRDVFAFLAFLTEHCGAPPDLAALGSVGPRDLRSWLARRRAIGGRGWRGASATTSLQPRPCVPFPQCVRCSAICGAPTASTIRP
jgi:integrase/recombinase XerC